MRPAALLLLLASVSLSHAADGDSAETIVRAFYETISGPAGTRDWARFKTLFAAGARIIPMRVTPDATMPRVMTPEEFSKSVGANFEKNAFYEIEVSRKAETFGSIAHVFSTYEQRRSLADKPFARGINSFQLVKEGASWKVMTILWDSERDGNPIPPKYLSPFGGSKVAVAR